MKGYKRVVQIIEKDEYDLVILDEGNIAVKYKLFSEHDLINLFEKNLNTWRLLLRAGVRHGPSWKKLKWFWK
jgi:ATP:corrinoid adenosyltransferase